ATLMVPEETESELRMSGPEISNFPAYWVSSSPPFRERVWASALPPSMWAVPLSMSAGVPALGTPELQLPASNQSPSTLGGAVQSIATAGMAGAARARAARSMAGARFQARGA